MVQGISNLGKDAIKRFVQITGGHKTGPPAPGNVSVGGHPVAVRTASDNTVNQVRAVRYLPIAVFHAPRKLWYVVPPHDVVRFALGKKKGQHGANPFESITLSVKELSTYKVSSENDLLSAVNAALAAGEQHPKLRETMKKIQAKVEEVSLQSKEWVLKL